MSSKHASSSSGGSNDDDDTTATVEPKPWIERYWYAVVLAVVATMVAGALVWYLIRRAAAKAQNTALLNVTPAMLPQAVPGTTYSYFDLPQGVRNWDPTRVGAGTAAGAATVMGGAAPAPQQYGTQYAQPTQQYGTRYNVPSQYAQPPQQYGTRYNTQYAQPQQYNTQYAGAVPAAYAPPITQPTIVAPQQQQPYLTQAAATTQFTLPTALAATGAPAPTALDAFIARTVTQPPQIRPTQQRTLRQGFQAGFDSLLSDA